MRTKSFILGAILMLFAGLVFVVGVFAASNASVNINGIVNFEAIGNVKATVAFEHTANNNIKVMKNESEVTNANGVLTIVGNESNMTGSFVSETIDLEAPAGAKGDVTYTYTLTITNTYASDAVADKKDLQITFTPPTTTANISSHFQSNYDWTDNSLILAPGAKVKVRVTFSTDVNYSNNANLTSSLRLEAVQSENRQDKPEEFAMTYNIVGATKTGGDNFAIQGDNKEITLQAENPDYTKWTITVDGQPVEPTIDWTQEKTTATISLANISQNSTIAVSTAIDYWDGTTATGFAGGTGTQADPYLIRNGAQLQNINNMGSTSGLYYKMMNNIYLNEETLTGESATAQPWTPISTFDGTFDGNGYCVSGMYINLETESRGALFNYVVSSGIVKNVGVKNTYIKAYSGSGAIVGLSLGTIENCYFEGNIIAGSSYNIGGIVGVTGGGVVRNCYNLGLFINGTEAIGGIVGHCVKGKIENCYNFGNVNNTERYLSGGITGYAGFHEEDQVAQIINCFNVGNITGAGYYVGSIVGEDHPYRNNIIQNCYYLPNTAVDGSGKIQNGIGTNVQGSALADVAGQTATATEENFKSMDWLVNTLGWDPNIWEILPNGGYPTLKVFNKTYQN